ncbi:unnamed protein product [Urochloa humidicola]
MLIAKPNANKPTFNMLLLLLIALAFTLPAFTTSREQFVYSGFTGANITVDGSARITPTGLLELTNGSYQLKGHAFYPAPVRFHRSRNGTAQSFFVSFVFGIISAFTDVSGQGIAFFLSPSRDFSTALPSQYMGLVNDRDNGNASNHILAVELDTVQNNEFNDIDSNHVGININGLNSMNSSSAGYYDDKSVNFYNLTLMSSEVMRVWIDYDGEAKRLDVTLAPVKMAKPVRPLVSSTHDLSQVLTDMSFIGFSSATGMVNTRHYILGWSFGMHVPAPPIDVAKLPRLPRVGPKKDSRVLEIILPLATASFFLTVSIIAFLAMQRHARYAEVREDWEEEFGAHRFSYKDLFRATEGFKDKHLLGVGGFGRVYKGLLPVSKLEIAVKRVSHDSKQGMKEFIAEVVSIGRLQHRNLVKLIGYCRRKGELLLVYEYMSNGSLDKYLFSNYDDDHNLTLDWSQRFQIIRGIAAGLHYLHEEWEKVIIHRDIKASNVLLDNQMNGRLGDFGLARLYDHGVDPQTTHVVGTLGYIAPELARTGKATPVTDVYAFGVFVLEVTCGRRPINQSAEDNQLMLVDWVLEHWQKGLLTDTMDIKLQGRYDIDEACLLLKLGLLCSHPFRNSRPSMRQVLEYLNGDKPLPELSPANLSYYVMSMMQNEGFDDCIMSSSVTSSGAVSGLSGGR